MKQYLFLPIAAILFALTGCFKSEPPTVGQEMPFNSVCDKSNDGKRIAFEGFLTLPDHISSKDKVSLLLEVRPSKDLKSPMRIGVWTSYGKEVNQLTFVETSFRSNKPNEPGKISVNSSSKLSYTHQDLKVKTNEGKVVSYLDKVRVSGKVVFPSNPPIISKCLLNNPLIESIK